jgi:glutamyl-tRNA synthetase
VIPKEVLEQIRKYAVKNSVEYGTARVESVLGKVIRSVAKEDVPELKTETKRIVDEVNSLSKEELDKEYAPHEKEFKEQYEKKVEENAKPKMILDGAVKGNFSTRFPPEPGGYMHIGNAKAAFLDSEFARIYDGTIALYFDDTNPEKSKQMYVDAFKKDLAWLQIKFDKEYYASDHIGSEYTYAEKMIKEGNAYVCTCDENSMKTLRFEGKQCEHRARPPEASLKLWKDMLADKFKDNQAVLRLAGQMDSLNTTMRDPVLFRIIHCTHYRQGDKYVVWPTYDFNTPIVDSTEGLTDIFRDKDYELRDELYYKILEFLELRKPQVHSFSRLKITNNITSKRKLRELIDSGRITGWDDPRIMTITALKRRGIQPLAIKEFVLRFGMSKSEGIMDIAFLLAENKKLIDPVSRRLFSVQDPVKLIVAGAPKRKAKLRLHPTADLGFRESDTNGNFYLSREDAADLKTGDIVRLKDLYTVKISGGQKDEIKAEVTEGSPDKTIQWVACDGAVNCTILIPEPILLDNGDFNKDSLKTVKGYAEPYSQELVNGDIVQFERFGFVILDDADQMRFIFISK